MRVGWGAPGQNVLSGVNNAADMRIYNTIKKQFQQQQDSLQLHHQEEQVVDGGIANTIQFHYLLAPQINLNGAQYSPSVSAGANGPFYIFDANSGAAGAANWHFPRRP